jgi:hypothetical protein
MRRISTEAALVTAGVTLAALGCNNDVMDASCTPDDPDITIDDDCPYQQARGPQIPKLGCRDQRKKALPGGKEEPSTPRVWQEVVAIFNDKNTGNCTHGGCHGDEATAAWGIWLPAADPVRFYDTLREYTGTLGVPYVSGKDSWIDCNVHGDPGSGFTMPKPDGLRPAEASIVRDWVLSGAPGPGQ